MPEFRRLPSIDEAYAALDGPAYDADLTRRAEKWAGELRAKSGPGLRHIGTDFYAKVAWMAGTELDAARAPMRFERFGNPTTAEQNAAVEDTNRRVHALVVRELKIHLRAADVADIHRDPERMSQDTVFGAYDKGVAAWAWSRGDKEGEAIRQWKRLILSRAEAEEDEDDREVARCDARLLALVGIPYPQYPEAAWLAADTYSQGERQAEYDRLTELYGPRNAAANGSAKIRSTRRLTRPLSAHATAN